MVKLSEERLYQINGGGQEDYDFGYKIGHAAKQVCNAVQDAWDTVCDTVSSWF